MKNLKTQTLTRQEIYTRFIKNRFASQHPKWILELPRQFVEKGYATLEGDQYHFTVLPKPHEVTRMLRDNAALFSIGDYERRVKHIHTYLGIKIPHKVAIGLLIAFLLADVLYLGINLTKRRQTHEVRNTSSAINL